MVRSHDYEEQHPLDFACGSSSMMTTFFLRCDCLEVLVEVGSLAISFSSSSCFAIIPKEKDMDDS